MSLRFILLSLLPVAFPSLGSAGQHCCTAAAICFLHTKGLSMWRPLRSKRAELLNKTGEQHPGGQATRAGRW